MHYFRRKKMKDCLKLYGYLLFAEILTLFLNLTLAFSASPVIRLLTAFCTVGILAGLMAQAGHSIAKANRRTESTPSPKKSVILGLVSILPFQLLWIVLALAKYGIVDGNFYRFYKLLCAPFLPVCNLICDDVTAHSLPLWGLVVLALCTAIPFAAVVIAYQNTHEQ
jgi:hypothetical protein